MRDGNEPSFCFYIGRKPATEMERSGIEVVHGGVPPVDRSDRAKARD